MSAENSPMTRDSIELSLCNYGEILKYWRQSEVRRPRCDRV